MSKTNDISHIGIEPVLAGFVVVKHVTVRQGNLRFYLYSDLEFHLGRKDAAVFPSEDEACAQILYYKIAR